MGRIRAWHRCECTRVSSNGLAYWWCTGSRSNPISFAASAYGSPACVRWGTLVRRSSPRIPNRRRRQDQGKQRRSCLLKIPQTKHKHSGHSTTTVAHNFCISLTGSNIPCHGISIHATAVLIQFVLMLRLELIYWRLRAHSWQKKLSNECECQRPVYISNAYAKQEIHKILLHLGVSRKTLCNHACICSRRLNNSSQWEITVQKELYRNHTF